MAACFLSTLKVCSQSIANFSSYFELELKKMVAETAFSVVVCNKMNVVSVPVFVS